MPLFGLLAYGVWFVLSALLQMFSSGIVIMDPASASGSNLAEISIQTGMVCLLLFFVYMQLSALGLPLGLFLAGMVCVAAGAILFCLLYKWMEIKIAVLVLLALCLQCAILFKAGRSAPAVPFASAAEADTSK